MNESGARNYAVYDKCYRILRHFLTFLYNDLSNDVFVISTFMEWECIHSNKQKEKENEKLLSVKHEFLIWKFRFFLHSKISMTKGTVQQNGTKSD